QLLCVMRQVVQLCADYLIDFNVSSRCHYETIKDSFAKQFKLDELHHDSLLDVFKQKLSRRIRELRNRGSGNGANNKQCSKKLNWDANRYDDGDEDDIKAPSTSTLIYIDTNADLKKFVIQLNDSYENNEMKTGKTSQLIVESFRVRRAYLTQVGQSMQQILNEMPFTKDLNFIKVDFELITKCSLKNAAGKLKNWVEHAVHSGIYGDLPDENKYEELLLRVCTRIGKRYRNILHREEITGDEYEFDLQKVLDKDNICPLLYSVTLVQRQFYYITFGNQILIQFENDEEDFPVVLSTLLALFYVFDVVFPRTYKSLLEIIDYFALSNDETKLKQLTVTAQAIIVEFNKKN
ncbi:unnamed protein product, partial [Didymodactylos carnosus]